MRGCLRGTFLLAILCLTTCAKVKSGSDLRVFGGVEDPSGFPASMMIRVESAGAAPRFCAGNFIRNDLLLTSAQCLVNANRVSVLGTFAPFNGPGEEDLITSESFTLHPQFKPQPDGQVSAESRAFDLGIVSFIQGTAPLELVVHLPTESPLGGQSVRVVGFDATGSSSPLHPGIKKVERQQLTEVLSGPGALLKVAGGAATSGTEGPSLLSLPASLYNNRFELVGMTTTPSAPPTPSSEGTPAYFVNLSAPSSHSFIDQALQMTPKNLLPVVTLRVTPKSRIGFSCQSGIARLHLPPTSQPTFLVVFGYCRPTLSCEGPVLIIKADTVQQKATLVSDTACSEAKTELDQLISQKPKT